MFITAVVFGLVFLASAAAVLFARRDETRGSAFGIAGLTFALAVICGIIASMSVVPTRNVGIVTTWGKPTGRTTGAGLQWTAPWSDVDDWDASGQTYAHLGDQCVWVTVKGPRDVCVPVQIEWAALPENAPENWAAFKEADGMSRFETWVARRVNPQIESAINTTFADFDPFKNVDKTTGEIAAPNLNAAYRKPLSDALAGTLGGDIAVRTVAFGRPVYDKATTDALAGYSQRVLDGRNLQVDKANAAIRKDITNIAGQADPVSRCLSIAEASGKEPGWCLNGGPTLTRSIN